MQTLDAPVYEVLKESQWYQSEKKRREDVRRFFKAFKEKYGVVEGFGFYHSEYFGVEEGSESYERFKDEVRKPDNKGFCAFKKRSKFYSEIKEMIDQIEERDPFKPHHVFGLNNITGSHWIGDRWFFGIKNQERVKDNEHEVALVDYKDYLKFVIENIE